MGRKIETVSLKEFATDHGFKSDRMVRNWIAEGMPHRNVGGERRVVRADANVWVREREREVARNDASPVEADERARKLRAEADLKEIDLAERRRQLVPLADYQERLEGFLGRFSAAAAGRLTRFERDIVEALDPPAARRITQAIHVALMQAAQDYADQLESEETDAPDEPEDAAA